MARIEQLVTSPSNPRPTSTTRLLYARIQPRTVTRYPLLVYFRLYRLYRRNMAIHLGPIEYKITRPKYEDARLNRLSKSGILAYHISDFVQEATTSMFIPSRCQRLEIREKLTFE